jgi:putative solute:sodium symporter small subunit
LTGKRSADAALQHFIVRMVSAWHVQIRPQSQRWLEQIYPKEETLMQLTQKHVEYWNRNLKMTAFLLAIWFVVTFVFGWYARELNEINIIGPLGFYMGAQGALIIYVLIIWFYARYMNNLDQEYGVHEGEDD